MANTGALPARCRAGDFVCFPKATVVPATGLLRRGINLSVDESLLTGESVQSGKFRHGWPGTRPACGDDLPSVFSGSLVTAGQGMPRFVATGSHSGLGKDRQCVGEGQTGANPLAEGDTAMVRTFAIVGPPACASPWCWSTALPRGGGSEVLETGFLAGIAMAMATLPEEFPVVLTIFLRWGLAHFSQECAHAADAGDRDAGGRHCPLRRQDGNADPEPDDLATDRWSRQGSRSCDLQGALPEEFHAYSRMRSWHEPRSLRPNGPRTTRGGRIGGSKIRSICIRTGRLPRSTP